MTAMIKAILFDFFNTLVCYEPSREQVYSEMSKELGFNIEPRAFSKPIQAADTFWRAEERRSPIEKRPQQEKMAAYIKYATMLFHGSGAAIRPEAGLEILLKLKQRKWEFKLYEDSLPTLKILRGRGLTLGLISNIGQGSEKIFSDLGLIPHLDFNVTSFEVGCDKPDPRIFQAALKKARVMPEETLCLGDQYEVDIVGAKGVGINAILLDRNNWFSEITDCPRIRTLPEITRYI
jgi:HAD superfamily hydrolase (TIGR01549 family)